MVVLLFAYVVRLFSSLKWENAKLEGQLRLTKAHYYEHSWTKDELYNDFVRLQEEKAKLEERLTERDKLLEQVRQSIMNVEC